MLDETNIKILTLLMNNSRMQWREIGEEVHLTGQAVANRIRKMEDLGIIEGYTVKINENKLGNSVLAFITVFMKTTDHQAFLRFIDDKEIIKEANQISGEGCYLLRVNTSTQEELLGLLNEMLKYGNYRVNLSIGKVK
ncbi:MAG TPA: Lrp/AsnC family transcriptional regulator [Syntrophomonadaceae bacterium]|nr:Lrp/AsnC family transcriptional regulator [Syntrophomonadaceae bacterium]